ncbi:MAG: hypothetical protein HQ469_01870, partial [Cyanobacteria bacterium]|nr:hypothetical protein [Cyanobacteria bacterium bin.275]
MAGLLGLKAAVSLLGFALLAAGPALAQSGDAAPPGGQPQPAAQQLDNPLADPAAPAPAQTSPAETSPAQTSPAQEPAASPAPAASTEPAPKAEPKVLIAEVAIEGLQDHPERERLELAAYAAMAATPGSLVTRTEL